MAGHSKWANIKHRKAAQDAKRGKVFTKIAVEITVAARIGGGDPDGNPRLRAAILKGRGVSMPKDNIERAVLKGAGGGEGVDYTERTYEGYGIGGVAVVVECLTDNINRLVAEVRHAFSRHAFNYEPAKVSKCCRRQALYLGHQNQLQCISPVRA